MQANTTPPDSTLRHRTLDAVPSTQSEAGDSLGYSGQSTNIVKHNATKVLAIRCLNDCNHVIWAVDRIHHSAEAGPGQRMYHRLRTLRMNPDENVGSDELVFRQVTPHTSRFGTYRAWERHSSPADPSSGQDSVNRQCYDSAHCLVRRQTRIIGVDSWMSSEDGRPATHATGPSDSASNVAGAQ